MKQWEVTYIIYLTNQLLFKKELSYNILLPLTDIITQTWESQFFHVCNSFTTIQIIQLPFSYCLHLIQQFLTEKILSRFTSSLFKAFYIQSIIHIKFRHSSLHIWFMFLKNLGQRWLLKLINKLCYCQIRTYSKPNLARIYVEEVCEPLQEDKAKRIMSIFLCAFSI